MPHHAIKCRPAVASFWFDPDGDSRSPWVTACRHEFASSVLKVVIPQGFRSDLASVPTLLLFLAPPFGNHQRAALLHDELYRTQPEGCPRALADSIFFAVMVDDGVPAWRAWCMYLAVRLFGWKAWNAWTRWNAQAGAK